MRDLIAQHGEDAGAFLQVRIDALFAAGYSGQLNARHLIRNAVAMTLRSDTTLH